MNEILSDPSHSLTGLCLQDLTQTSNLSNILHENYSQSFLFPIFHKKIEDEDSLLVPVFKWVSSTKVLAPQPTPLIHFNTLGCITQDFLKIIDKSWQADMKTNKHKVNVQVE